MHPLSPDLTKLSLEELSEKRSELQKRMSFAYRTGNSDMIQQLTMMIDDYEQEEKARAQKTMNDMQNKNKNFGNIINISR
tara:strand:+ start:531 stop:770 length:240 start_codon:yes stop_codon:yes gene_type:complete